MINLASAKKTSWVDEKFHISARNSSVKTEVTAGSATFMSMVYIIPVSAGMYAAAGVESTAAGVAIALVTCLISILMGWIANIPIALSTGMGLNAFAVFSICLGMGYSFDLVMVCTFIEGVIFLLLSLTGVRSKLAMSLPHNLKMFIGAGIGLFLMYIGWQNTHFIVNDDSTLTTMVSFRQNFSTQGITAVLAVFGLITVIVLTAKQVKAAIIIGIFATWILGMLCQAIGIYVPDFDAGYYSLYPTIQFTNPFAVGSICTDLKSITFDASMLGNIIVITGTMFYSDFFDTLGTCMTCIVKIKAQMVEEIKQLKLQKYNMTKVEAMEAELREIESEQTTKLALIVDAIGTIIGSFFRNTTITSFVESGAAIESGGRTGLSAVVTGAWFFLAIFFASIFTSIPGFATGPALVVVGASMAKSALQQVNWEAGLYELLPGVVCVAATCLTYNIANGMAAGIITYVVATLFTKHRKELSPAIYVVATLLVAKFIFL